MSHFPKRCEYCEALESLWQ